MPHLQNSLLVTPSFCFGKHLQNTFLHWSEPLLPSASGSEVWLRPRQRSFGASQAAAERHWLAMLYDRWYIMIAASFTVENFRRFGPAPGHALLLKGGGSATTGPIQRISPWKKIYIYIQLYIYIYIHVERILLGNVCIYIYIYIYLGKEDLGRETGGMAPSSCASDSR